MERAFGPAGMICGIYAVIAEAIFGAHCIGVTLLMLAILCFSGAICMEEKKRRERAEEKRLTSSSTAAPALSTHFRPFVDSISKEETTKKKK